MKKLFWFTVGFTLVFSLVFAAYARADQPSELELFASAGYFQARAAWFVTKALAGQQLIDEHWFAKHLNAFHGIDDTGGSILSDEQLATLRANVTKSWEKSREFYANAQKFGELYQKLYGKGAGDQTRTPDQFNSSPRRFE